HTPHPRSRSAANVSPSMTRSTVARHVQVEVTTSTSPPQRERTSRYTSRYTSEWYVQPVFADVTRRNQRMNRVGACARYDTNTPVEVLVTDTAAVSESDGSMIKSNQLPSDPVVESCDPWYLYVTV